MKNHASTNPSATVPARQRILDAADRLFYGEGLRATGVDRIIAESGVAKMSFYRHFPAKRDLIVAFLENRRLAWITWFRGEVEARIADGGGLEVIADALEAWFAQEDFRGCTFVNAVAEGAHSEPSIAGVVAEHKGDLVAYIEELAVRLGLSPPGQVAEAVMVVLEGSVVRAQTTGRHGDATIGKVLLRGIARDFAAGQAPS